MQSLITAVVASGSTRRFAALLIGAGSILLTKHFGLELSDLDKEAITAIIMTFMAQSAWKETTLEKVRIAGENAAGAAAALPTPQTKLDFLKAQLAEEEARIASQNKAG